jgi:TonB family protein
MSRYLIIAPLSLLVVMVLYLGMHGLLHQQQMIEFKGNDSEFSFDDYQLPAVLETGRTFSCGLGSITPPTKAELWKETKAVLFLPYVCTLTISTDTNDIIKRPNVRKTSQSILNELIQKDPFSAFVNNKSKPPYNQKLTLSWMPLMQYPYDAIAIEGWVELEIKVNTQGTVDDIHVIAANPPRVFDRTVLRSYKKAKFLPEIINGKAVAKTIIQRIDFKLAED